MNTEEKIEFAKQQIDKTISSGNRKEDVYTTVLNTAKSVDLAVVLFTDLIEEDISVSIKVLQKITNKEVKERLQESFFSYLLGHTITEYTITGLNTLGRSYQEKFFLDQKELLNDLISLDDYVYDALINIQEHVLYINYVEMCYAHTGFIPDNVEKLVNSDIRTVNDIQDKLYSLENKMYKSGDYDNLFFLASSTNTLDNIKKIFNNSSSNIYEIVRKKKCKQKTYYYAYFLDSKLSELDKRIKWHEKLIKETINEFTIAELIITRYQIRILELDNNIPFYNLTILPNDSTKKYLEQITEEDKYEIFKMHAKLFNKTYSNPDKYKQIIEEDPKWNPFKSIDTYAYERVADGKKIPQLTHNRPLINFRDNEQVKSYLDKEKEVLKQEAIMFTKNIKKSVDNTVKFYFSSILHYTISFGELLECFGIMRKRDEFFLIYNTLLEGTFEYINNELFLNTEYDNLKITYTEDSNLENRIIPGVRVEANISSYGYYTKEFRIANFVAKENNDFHNFAVELSRKVRRQEDFIITSDEIEEDGFFIELCRTDFLSGIYCYLKSRTTSTIIKNQLKEVLHFKVDRTNDDSIMNCYYEYLLGNDKNIVITNISRYIRTMLDSYSFRSTEDLTRYKGFNIFRTNTYLIFNFIKEFDLEFFNELISNLEQGDLLSITYWNTENDYYKELLEEKNSYIREFYKIYPTYAYQLQDIKELVKDEKDDIKFYLYLKVLSKDLNKYSELEDDILNTFKEDNRFIEWIKRIDLNIQLMNKENLLYPLKGLECLEPVEEEKKKFFEIANKLLNYKEEKVVGTTIKELIRSIQFSISDERLDKIKELSTMELTRTELIDLVSSIIEVLENTNCSPISRLNLLKALGNNNPFTQLNKKEFNNRDKELIKKINSIGATLSPEEKVDLYFLSPQHFLLDTYFFSLHNRQVILNSNYLIKGTVNVTNYGTKATVYPTNVLCKENHLSCDINMLKNDLFYIIPHYDELSFKIIDIKNKVLEIEAVINFDKQEERLKKSLEDYSYFNSLYREEKEQILMHYCRKDVIKAFEFDKDKIISEETYLDISRLMSTYSVLGTNHLYLSLLLDREDLFNERFQRIPKINDKQDASLSVQRKILEENNPICFDRLILYLKKINCLHDVFLLEEAKDKYKDREVFINNYKQYNKDGLVEHGLRTYDLKEFVSIKSLEFEKVYESGNVDNYIEKYMRHPYPTDYEIGYTKYLIYKIITIRKEFKDEYYTYLKEKKEIIDLKLILNDRLSNSDVKRTFKSLKDNISSYDDYKKIVEYAKVFPFMIEDIEKLVVEDKSLYTLLDEITLDKDDLLYLNLRLTQIYNTIKNVGAYSPYNIKIIEFVFDIKNRFELYKILNREEEIKELIDFLLKNNINIKRLVKVDEYKNFLSDNQFELINKQSKISRTPLEESIKLIPSLYSLTKLFNSDFYIGFNNFCNNIEELNKMNSSKELVLNEIKYIEEILDNDSDKDKYFNILLYQFKVYGILCEEVLLIDILKDNYLKFIGENKVSITNKYYLNNLINYFSEDENDLELYKTIISGSKSKITNLMGKYRRYYKKRRYVKEISFQKDLFDKYYELFYSLKKLNNSSQPSLKRVLDILVFISMLDKSFVPKNINLSAYSSEQLKSSKTELIEADYYLLDNYSKGETYLLENAKDEYKYYIYLVLSYWNNKIDYKINLEYNSNVKDILKDFIVVTLIDGFDVDKFFESLGDNNIKTIIDENEYNSIYVSAVKIAFDILQQKTEWDINNNVYSVLKVNPLEKIGNLELKETMVNRLSQEQFDLINTYYDIKIIKKMYKSNR